MSAHVLLNSPNELGKSDKMRGVPSILSLFRNAFNIFNNTGARMLDSIYHRTLDSYFKKSHFWSENVKILPSFTQRYIGRYYVTFQPFIHSKPVNVYFFK